MKIRISSTGGWRRNGGNVVSRYRNHLHYRAASRRPCPCRASPPTGTSRRDRGSHSAKSVTDTPAQTLHTPSRQVMRPRPRTANNDVLILMCPTSVHCHLTNQGDPLVYIRRWFKEALQMKSCRTATLILRAQLLLTRTRLTYIWEYWDSDHDVHYRIQYTSNDFDYRYKVDYILHWQTNLWLPFQSINTDIKLPKLPHRKTFSKCAVFLKKERKTTWIIICSKSKSNLVMHSWVTIFNHLAKLSILRLTMQTCFSVSLTTICHNTYFSHHHSLKKGTPGEQTISRSSLCPEFIKRTVPGKVIMKIIFLNVRPESPVY